MSRWLSVVGIGEDGLDGLAPAARTLVETAETLVGGRRHLALVPAPEGEESPIEHLSWASPLSATVEEIAARRGRRLCVLASGDPMSFGIGVTLARRFPLEEMTIIPAASAFSLACARMGWPREEVETLTLHGRPLDLVNLHLADGARLLILSEDGDTPARVAARLRERGYGRSRITVLEHMGGRREKRAEGTAAGWRKRRPADLNTIAVHCRAGPRARALPRLAGLPDDVYDHDGQLTKRAVRAAALAALAPLPGALLWDVGAGAGSVAIEWMRAGRGASAVAVERARARCARIAANAAALGVPGLEVVEGAAPAALAGLAAPDAVFIGGGITEPGLIEACWQALPKGGRLVANVVSLEGEAALARWREALGGALTRISVAELEPIGRYHGWRPAMPVTQWAAVKGAA